MKRIVYLLGMLAAVAVFTLLAFSSPDSETAAKVYRRAWSGTITDAGNDTLSIPVTLSSLWTYNYVLDAAQTSGTTSIIAIVQENNSTSGSIWYEETRDTLTGAGTIRVKQNEDIPLVLGSRQRLILDGAGTQVSPYTVTGTFKGTN